MPAFDDDGLVQFNAAFFFLDYDFALLGNFLANLPVAPGIDTTVEETDHRFKDQAELFKGPQPGHAGKQTPAGRHGTEQQQRRAGVTHLRPENTAEFDAKHAPRGQGQLRPQGIKAQGFERRTGNQQEQETTEGDIQRMAVDDLLAVQPAETAPDEHAEKDDQPPGGETEEVEQQVGNPRAGTAGRVMDDTLADRVRPAGIGLIEPPQRHAEEKRDGTQPQPARLLQEITDFFRQRTGRAAC